MTGDEEGSKRANVLVKYNARQNETVGCCHSQQLTHGVNERERERDVVQRTGMEEDGVYLDNLE